MFLREITQKVQFLKGIGPKLAALFARLGIISVADLLLHAPRDYDDRREKCNLREAPKRERANVIAHVVAHDYLGSGHRGSGASSRKQTLKVFIQDDSGVAVLVCFGRNFLGNVLVPGKRFFFSGTFTYRFGEIQSTNFDYIPIEEYEKKQIGIFPLYPLTEGLTQKTVARAVARALEAYGPRIDDELPAAVLQKYRFPGKREAIAAIHFPPDRESLETARRRLKYEELFFLELMIARRALQRRIKRIQREVASHALRELLVARLPFALTGDQQQAIGEIEGDLFAPYPMMRLLQGDVGSGKTLVAVASALAVIEAGEQAGFMAPTELLARQHAAHIAALVEPLGVRTALLSGSIDDQVRGNLLAALQQGAIDLVIGTHALFSADVVFKKLGLVIIDEQHRFGVLQRKALMEKGFNPDLLLMTATPIPRSLALTAFGDLDVSLIKTKPAGRLPVITHLARQGNEDKVYQRVRTEIMNGRQAYFIYPLIGESEKIDLKNAIGMYENLKRDVFGEFKLGLIHSKVGEEEKRLTMERFAGNEIDILVATSVVEVGVDVPNAVCMVIEHAERFGLSALHQLRGRVGRSDLQSYAFLIYGNELTDEAVRRLKIMMETSDGFRIAEEDLRIRGPGALLGVEQSGYLRLCFADLARDVELLLEAKRDAEEIIKTDAGLLQPEHKVIRDALERVPQFDEELLDTG